MIVWWLLCLVTSIKSGKDSLCEKTLMLCLDYEEKLKEWNWEEMLL
jgi:hypothetical protein